MEECASAGPATLPESGVTVEAASAAAGRSEGRRGLASEESPMRSSQDMDLMSTEWTDEKHNLYLNSIEASFISQLYSSEYSLDDFHGLSPITKKDNASASNINHRSTGQFKVQRDGSWGKINFERATNHVENKARLLTANPWIQHFRSPLIRRERETKSSEQNGSMDMAIMESGHGKYREEFASSDHPIDTCSQIYYQASDGSTAEVMDQNFVDMNSKEKLIGSKKRRRMRTKLSSATKGTCT
ncbi:hypothetical protein ACMD2_14452 [Ananas comosus]|uniref:Uncharacterized protein n=1 Tax=Ananas comosus TaxID=4615 RepID=A0A199V620_ANACO|nr:hypothetical protein ACMD2_14452 [Ananas comosus]